MEQKVELRLHRGIIACLMTPGFRKWWPLTLKEQSFFRKLKKEKKNSCMDCESPNSNFSRFASWTEISSLAK
jgi:hypothetical protein